MASLEYDLLDRNRHSSLKSHLKMAAWLLTGTGLLVASWFTGKEASGGNVHVPMTVQNGMEQILAKPGVPLPALLGPSAPSCLFSYGSLRQFDASSPFVDSAAVEDGWVYGAQMRRFAGEGAHAWGMLAQPTAKAQHVVKGQLLCWPAMQMPLKLKQSDQQRGFDPSKAAGLLQRGVVWVVRQDKDPVRAYWYYQDTVVAPALSMLRGGGAELLSRVGPAGVTEAQIVRALFAAAQVAYKDTACPSEACLQERLGTKTQPGLLEASLERLPVLFLPDGTALGPGAAMERFVAKDLGMYGKTPSEEAQIDAYCEHLREIRRAYAKVRGNAFQPRDQQAQAREEQWFGGELKQWLAKLEQVTGAGGHAVGQEVSLADVSLYMLLTQSFDVQFAEVQASYAACPKIQAVLSQVGNLAGLQDWLAKRSKRY